MLSPSHVLCIQKHIPLRFGCCASIQHPSACALYVATTSFCTSPTFVLSTISVCVYEVNAAKMMINGYADTEAKREHFTFDNIHFLNP